jgi:hypothetical protein
LSIAAHKKIDRVVESLVVELFNSVDVLVVPVLPAILAAKQVTKTIPIVMVLVLIQLQLE